MSSTMTIPDSTQAMIDQVLLNHRLGRAQALTAEALRRTISSGAHQASAPRLAPIQPRPRPAPVKERRAWPLHMQREEGRPSTCLSPRRSTMSAQAREWVVRVRVRVS